MSEEDTARKKIDIWSKRFHVFEDRCIRRAFGLSGEMLAVRERLEETKMMLVTEVTELRRGTLRVLVNSLDAAHRSLRRRAQGGYRDGDWAEETRGRLRAFLDPGKLILADIIEFIETPEIRMMLGPEIIDMDEEELEVADCNRLYYGRALRLLTPFF